MSITLLKEFAARALAAAGCDRILGAAQQPADPIVSVGGPETIPSIASEQPPTPAAPGCPFCGYQEIEIDEIDLGVYAVSCPVCLCVGPVSFESPEHASELWGTRPGGAA